MRHEMRPDPAKHLAHRRVGIARHHEGVEPQGWRHHAKLGGHDDDHAPPDRVIAEAQHHRHHDRHGQHEDRHLVEEGAQQDVDQHQHDDDAPARQRQLSDPAHQALSGLRHRKEGREHMRRHHDERDHAGGARGLGEDLVDLGRGAAGAGEIQDRRPEGAKRRGFAGRGHATIYGAGHRQHQQQHRPDQPQQVDLFAQRHLFADRRALGLLPGEEIHRERDGRGHDDARNDARHQHLRDAHIGQKAVDDHRHARRDQHRQRTRDRHHAGGHRALVIVFQHRRKRGRGQGRGGGGRRAADRPEPGTGQRRGDPQTASHPAEPRRGSAEQVVGDAGFEHQLGHQQKHRHGDELAGDRGLTREGGQDCHHRQLAPDHVEPDGT